MKIYFILSSLTFLVCCTKWSQSAKILGVIPTVTSHYFLSEKVIRGLAEAGHELTVITSQVTKNIPKNGKITDIVIPEVMDIWKQIQGAQLFEQKSIVTMMGLLGKLSISLANATFQNPEVKKLIRSKSKFDLVFIEQFENDALKIYAHLFEAPLVIFSPTGAGGLVNHLVCNPSVPSYDPGFLSIEGERMTFLDRAKVLLSTTLFGLLRDYYTIPMQNKLLQENFPGAPDIWELNYNTSLVFLNSHTSFAKAVPWVPNMVEIGGYHIDSPKALPRDLQEILDNAKNGVILFSMGSNLKSKHIPEWKKRVLLNVFSKLKQTVLWKFEDDLPGRPENVIIKQWLPQNDILAHPNIKLFITHGGLLSTTETIYHGVPILVIPVFADQFTNADKAVKAGFALKLAFKDNDQWTEDNLYKIVQDLLNNPKYKNKVKHISELFHDRPMKPMETLIYWAEYVIRHKGAPHLKVGGVGMPFYKYFCLDVIGALLGIILGSFYVMFILLRKLCCTKRKEKQDKKLKKS